MSKVEENSKRIKGGFVPGTLYKWVTDNKGQICVYTCEHTLQALGGAWSRWESVDDILSEWLRNGTVIRLPSGYKISITQD